MTPLSIFRSWKLGCQAEIHVTANRNTGKLIVQTMNFHHNHDLITNMDQGPRRKSVTVKGKQTLRKARVTQQSPAKSSSSSANSKPSEKSANEHIGTLDETNDEQDKESGPSSSSSANSKPSKKSVNEHVGTLDETNDEQDKESGPSSSQEVEDTLEENVHHIVPLINTSVTVSSELLSEKDEFDSFDDFKQKLDAYCTENHVQLIISKSRSVQSINKTMGEDSRKFDDKLVYGNIRYACKYGQKRPSTSAGVHANQRYTLILMVVIMITFGYIDRNGVFGIR